MLARLLLLFFCTLLMVQCGNTPPAPPEAPPVPTVQAVQQTEVPPPTDQLPVLSDSVLSIAYVMGQFDPTERADFVRMAPPFAEDESMYLRKDTYTAFQKMHTAALLDSVQLTIRSATRNFDRQKQIWEAKWTGKRKIEGGKDATQAWPEPLPRALTILKWSSMPGTSRHHWGTDIDLNAFENEYFESGRGKREYDWLVAHAGDFGFCQVYSAKGKHRPNGYNEEKWHWSYIPVAHQLTNYARQHLRDSLIAGFEGAVTAREVGMVEKFVLGIAPECMQ